MAYEIRIKEMNGQHATGKYFCTNVAGEAVKLRPGETVVVTDLDLHLNTGKVELVKELEKRSRGKASSNL